MPTKIEWAEETWNLVTGRFVGKKAAGHLLDGQEWQQMPERVVGHENLSGLRR